VPSAVLLVDDVVTGGATITAAALTLRAAGATRVDALTAASTPLKLPRTVVEAKVNATGTRRYTPTR
jgi:adenine/guanine phosphoribosyltransferase-like PRPP-binding protein